MNLFLVASSGEADVRAPLERLLADLPFFPGCEVGTWRSPHGDCVAAWVHHAGQAYVHEGPDGFALFSGRPFRWIADDDADGRGPTDARFFLSPRGELDGRFVAVAYRLAERALEVMKDPAGAYPVFEASHAGVELISNSAALLREATGATALRPDSLAGLVGGGWPLDGHPIWQGVARMQPLCELEPDLGAGLDRDGAAARLTAAVRALADWPGRPNVVPVTGGRDSRVVLAAALAADLHFEAVTGGAPSDPDVEVARELCARAGVAHSLLPADPHGSMWSDHRRAARTIRLTAGGTASLADAAGFPLGPGEGSLPLWHSGQGGEVGRAYYGRAAGSPRSLTSHLYDVFTARRPHRPELLSPAGRELVERQLEGWTETKLAAGNAAEDLPDLFYLERRMATWAAPTHGCVEYVRDTTSPLWSRRVVQDLLAAPASERAGEPYHRAMLAALSPPLADIPFAGGGGFTARRGLLARRVARARSLAAKATRELRRRVRPPASDPFAPILADVREQTLSAADHEAWKVLDRSRCEALLSRPAGSLDEMRRYQVWRLATVFVE